MYGLIYIYLYPCATHTRILFLDSISKGHLDWSKSPKPKLSTPALLDTALGEIDDGWWLIPAENWWIQWKWKFPGKNKTVLYKLFKQLSWHSISRKLYKFRVAIGQGERDLSDLAWCFAGICMYVRARRPSNSWWIQGNISAHIYLSSNIFTHPLHHHRFVDLFKWCCP